VLFDEDDHKAARAERPDVVAPKKPSPLAKRKACTKRCPDGLPVHGFQPLLSLTLRNTGFPVFGFHGGGHGCNAPEKSKNHRKRSNSSVLSCLLGHLLK